MCQIPTVVGATAIDPKLLTAAERLAYEGHLRREETNVAIPTRVDSRRDCYSQRFTHRLLPSIRNFADGKAFADD
jgi:hypothetical protein